MVKRDVRTCNVCGGSMAWIRGQHPGDKKRLVCPTCAVEKLEDFMRDNEERAGQCLVKDD